MLQNTGLEISSWFMVEKVVIIRKKVFSLCVQELSRIMHNAKFHQSLMHFYIIFWLNFAFTQ